MDERDIPASYTWTIPRLPMVLSPNSRTSRYVLHKRHDTDLQDSIGYFLQAGYTKPLTSWSKARVKITFIVAQNRARDWDNWRPRGKGFLDSLKPASGYFRRNRWVEASGLGIIADDNMECIGEPEMVIVVDKVRAPATVIEVEAA